ncbi:MAG TPA: E3 binding domain-containing protein [Solirubrobacterales bacterium]|nr:E3 binding domain-containing protein [Solirubrobacterales bacterium]
MANQQTKRRAPRKESKRSGSGGSQRKRRASSKSGQGQDGSEGSQRSPLRNQTDESTVPEREYQDYTLLHPGSISDTDEPDVLVDIPVVKVDELHFELDNLEARISVHAEVLDLVKLSVGVHAELGKVDLDIKGVEAQALLRARLDHVTAIIDRVLTTLDRNPKLLESIGRSVEQIGAGAGEGVGQIGQGAGQAVEEVGEGAEGAVKDVGQGAGGAVEDVGGGAGQAVGGLGQGAGQALGDVGQLAAGAGSGSGGGGSGNGGGGNGLTGGRLAKDAAKVVVRELGSAATDEVKDLGLAATHKAMELGERRRQRRASRHNATEAALREAEAAGVHLDEVEGTGAEGRITVRDVKEASG